jgi:chromosome segregation ATPase
MWKAALGQVGDIATRAISEGSRLLETLDVEVDSALEGRQQADFSGPLFGDNEEDQEQGSVQEYEPHTAAAPAAAETAQIGGGMQAMGPNHANEQMAHIRRQIEEELDSASGQRKEVTTELLLAHIEDAKHALRLSEARLHEVEERAAEDISRLKSQLKSEMEVADSDRTSLHQTVELLKMELNDFHAAHEQTLAQVKHLQGQVEEGRRCTVSATIELDQMRLEKVGAEAALEDSYTQVLALESQLQRHGESEAARTMKATDLDDRAALAQLQTELTAEKAAVVQLRAEVAAKDAKTAQLEDDLAASITAVREFHKEILGDQRSSESREELAELHAKVATLTEQLQNAEQQSSGKLQAIILDLRNEVEQASQQKQELHSNNSEVELSQAVASSANLLSKVEALEEERNQAEFTIGALRHELDAIRAEATSDKAIILALEEEIGNTGSTIESLREELDSVREEALSAKAKMGLMDKELEKANATVSILHDELEKVKAGSAGDLLQANIAIAGLHEELRQSRLECDVQVNVLAESVGTAKVLQVDLEVAQASAEDKGLNALPSLEAEVVRSVTLISDLRATVLALNSELECTSSQKEAVETELSIAEVGLADEVRQLKATVESLREELKRCQVECDMKATALSKSNDAVQMLETDIEAAKADASSESERTRFQLTALEAEVANSSTVISDLQQELKTARETVADGLVDNLQIEIADLRDELEKARSDSDSASALARSKVSSLEDQLAERSSAVETLQADLDAARVELSAAGKQLRSHVPALEEELARARATIADVQEQLETAKAMELSAATAQGEKIEHLNANIDALKVQLKELRAVKAAGEQRLHALELELSQTWDTIFSLQQELVLGKSNSDCAENLAHAIAEIEDLRVMLGVCKAEIGVKASALAECSTVADNLREELGKTRLESGSSISLIKQELADSSAAMGRLGSDLESVTNAAEHLRARVLVLEEENAAVNTTATSLQRELEARSAEAMAECHKAAECFDENRHLSTRVSVLEEAKIASERASSREIADLKEKLHAAQSHLSQLESVAALKSGLELKVMELEAQVAKLSHQNEEQLVELKSAAIEREDAIQRAKDASSLLEAMQRSHTQVGTSAS